LKPYKINKGGERKGGATPAICKKGGKIKDSPGGGQERRLGRLLD